MRRRSKPTRRCGNIVRRDTGEGYQEFLTTLAQASGIETPTRADLARLDRKRKRKGSNTDWTSPSDPDAKIAKMKDGRTHLAHKAEHAVALDTGAIVAVTIQGADEGDTHTLPETLAEAVEQLDHVTDADGEPVALAPRSRRRQRLPQSRGAARAHARTASGPTSVSRPR